jgi:hypothetical protein
MLVGWVGVREAASKLAASDGWPWPLWRLGADGSINRRRARTVEFGSAGAVVESRRGLRCV